MLEIETWKTEIYGRKGQVTSVIQDKVQIWKSGAGDSDPSCGLSSHISSQALSSAIHRGPLPACLPEVWGGSKQKMDVEAESTLNYYSLWLIVAIVITVSNK